MPGDLPEKIYEEIERLSELGNIEMDAGNADRAIAYWRDALDLLPQPAHTWEAALWLYASIGDAQRELGLLEEALSSFRSAEISDDGYAHPFVQIGLGMTLYDLGQKDAATEHLLRAYMAEGADIFHPNGGKYLQHLADKNLLNRNK
ncbi:MAG: tetratricopeptide repeat protein [Paracoccus sp. (in: a-proteobacteria)]|uniref:tetratricopeptide repeat protein n=1 Tax=Paracoccus sp. TaxID=267 RepID=UPI0026DF58CA|nr:tetratricopeptide repeat protein [Paracoccus sp. (in: a-proteobacteria)]MDO5612461.1 tetratricopeptide repeat protein [Paracoccus sp. (in: a-proteobacteria)]